MAGRGSRFREAGYELPKPHIPARDKPLYTWAVDSLPLDYASEPIFILLREEPYLEEIESDIRARYGHFKPLVLHVEKVSEGQSITVLRARELIDSNESLLVHNSDTGFVIDPEWITRVEAQGVDGALLVFPSQEKRELFARRRQRLRGGGAGEGSDFALGLHGDLLLWGWARFRAAGGGFLPGATQ